MQTIKRRISLLLFTCSIIAILLTSIFVNITVNDRFNKYMSEVQDKRNTRIINYFEEIYKRDGKWDVTSGAEMMHEAYMGNYCLSLLDSNKKTIWGMDPKDIREETHFKSMFDKEEGVYSTNTFEIKNNGAIVGYINIGQYSSILLSKEDMNFRDSINESIIRSSIITTIIIIIISLYFSKQFSNPIKDVANMSVNLSKGEFNSRSSVESDISELEELRNSINVLAEKLRYQDMLRKRLVSDISHEIRTPLNVLQNNLEAMIDGVFPVTTERLIYLDEEVVRFGKLLSNLNVLKEFEAESITLDFETIALDDLVVSVCQDFTLKAQEKGIRLVYEIKHNEDFVILGDKDKLKQVIINLLSNSIKFTENEGNISVELYLENNQIILTIKDDGIGISKEDIPFIFERLYRADKSRHQVEGSGIGLTIVQNILQLHSAVIEVESQEGEGTTVKIAINKLDNIS